MKTLPSSPDLSHLKRQAKHLRKSALVREQEALARIAAIFPALEQPQLHDAQTVVAREYGFRSWSELKRFVEYRRADRADRLEQWLRWLYLGGAREQRLVLRTLREDSSGIEKNLWWACAVGDLEAIERAATNDAGGPLGMQPLLAVAHSLLIQQPEYEESLLASARWLLAHGANVNATWVHEEWPDSPLSALYGAAGKTHHPGMTKLLLEAGANPDDNESLYHSTEARDSACTRLLLDAGARVDGTNAIGRALDYGKLEDLKLMLARRKSIAKPRKKERSWLHHAIERGRSIEFVQALVNGGEDLRAVNHAGISVYRWAELYGREDVATLLRAAGVKEELSTEDAFVAACARGEERADAEEMISRLTEMQLKALPEQAAVGDLRAVESMLRAGWPREIKTAWDATGLHLAVYRGDRAMAELLLRYGADWRIKNGFGGDVFGTLSHASQEPVEDPAAPRDYVGCARALIEHGGVPAESLAFSDEVTTYLDSMARV